jgi:ABC-2 type transport system permease protein
VTRLVGAELFKLRTTRTFFAMCGGALALVLLITTLASALGEKHEAHPLRDMASIGGLSQIFVLIVGILAVTSEFRHGTITPTLLAIPERARLTVAKLGASLLVGLVVGLVCVGGALGLGGAILSGRGIASGSAGGDVARFVVGGAVAAALYGAFGVGLGAIVRNQVGAVIGILVYAFVLEPLLQLIPGLKHVVPKFGLLGVGNGVAATGGGSDTLGQVPAGLLFAGYCAVFLAVGIVLMRRRDVSA